jgi:ankyrin repeat protein
LEEKNDEYVLFLLKNKANVSISDNGGRTPLMAACVLQSPALLQVLESLSSIPDAINARRDDGKTALHLAVAIASGTGSGTDNTTASQVVTQLLAAGIDANIPDKNGDTALHLAGNEDIIGQLMRAGARDVPNNDGWTALMSTCRPGSVQVPLLKALIAHGSDINMTWEWRSALVLAVSTQNYQVISILLENKCDVNTLLSYGSTALHTAATFGEPSIVKQLLRAGGNPRIADNKGMTPLMRARNEETIRVFMEAAPDVANHRGKSGRNALALYCTEILTYTAIDELLRESIMSMWG